MRNTRSRRPGCRGRDKLCAVPICLVSRLAGGSPPRLLLGVLRHRGGGGSQELRAESCPDLAQPGISSRGSGASLVIRPVSTGRTNGWVAPLPFTPVRFPMRPPGRGSWPVSPRHAESAGVFSVLCPERPRDGEVAGAAAGQPGVRTQLAGFRPVARSAGPTAPAHGGKGRRLPQDAECRGQDMSTPGGG